MKRRLWLIGLALLAAIAGTSLGSNSWTRPGRPQEPVAQAQSPPATPQVSPPQASPPLGSSPSPTATSTPPQTPAGLPATPPVPEIGTPLPLPPPAPLPTPTTPLLPLSGTYQDANGKFRIGILQNYTISPLASSVLIEAPDGNLAYTVLVNSQAIAQQVPSQPNPAVGFPLTNPGPTLLTNEALAAVAREVFYRGEGFKPGEFQLAAQGGIQIPWTGRLTIAGKTQPVSGAIVARQSQADVFLLMIAATPAGANQFPRAIATLENSFTPL